MLLKYVSTYTPKFSGDFAKDWLNDEASTFLGGQEGSSSTTHQQSRRCGCTWQPRTSLLAGTVAARLMPFRVPYAIAGVDSENELVNLYQTPASGEVTP